MGLLVNVAVIIYVVTGECCGKLIKTPDNKTVSEGERTILECETDFHDLMHSIFWKFGNEDIFYGGEISLQYASKFGIQKDPTKGIYNLIIPSATKSHNGRYTCADDEGDGDKSYAWLTVTESPTTKANGNIHSSTRAASTGADALTDSTSIIIIAVPVSIAVVVVLLISVVIFCICKRKGRCSNEHEVKSCWMKKSAKQNEPRSIVRDRANKIEEQLKIEELEKQKAANQQRKTDSTKSGLKSKKPNLQKKNKMPELKSQRTFGTKANAVAEIKNAESNETKHIADDTFLDNSAAPLLLDSSSQSQSQSQTSEQKPENAESNETKHIADDTFLDNSAAPLLLDSSSQSQSQSQTSEQKPEEDIKNNGEEARDEENNKENTPLVSDKDNSSKTEN